MTDILAQLPRFVTYPNMLFFGYAFIMTLSLSAASCLAGALFGFALATLRVTNAMWLLPLRVFAIAFTESFRRVPPLVVLFLVFYSFSIAQVELPTFVVALIALCMIATAFITEIVRGGYDTIPQAQWDAAATMNFGLLQTLWYVVIPQAWRVIIPTLFVFFVMFIKDSALASQIGVMELTFVGKSFIDRGISPVLAFGVVLVLYFVLSYPLALVGKWLENRLVSS
ncbi:amino acid ABC transporter permease [Ensifer aridi]|uniref:amino acid ABC transporter permease n=1 Tax=Ensifer aridi TaxID=1708715 RepID=UPI000412E1C6|nr:amino acid ABC transporter permease [Ensifer aridi]